MEKHKKNMLTMIYILKALDGTCLWVWFECNKRFQFVSLEANRSIFGVTRAFCTARAKQLGSKAHSLAPRACLDSLSASVLDTPGICAAETQMPLLTHQSQTDLPAELQLSDWYICD